MKKTVAMEGAGEHIFQLGGEPDFDTPECVKEAAARAIRDRKTHYPHSLGLVELREAIAEHYLNQYRVKIGPDQALIASGTSPGMLLLLPRDDR